MPSSQEIVQVLTQHNAKDLLRFITCGNVDDGKSTLIGRLLLEAGAIYDDQIAALQAESKRHGTVGDRIDTALLLDGLEDERQQGITIDVAYRYFTTANRKFIIADTPGHEQFTRNMATGASTADLAIILVDATKGIATQTKRHAFIVSQLGIKHVVLAVNKMDLVAFSQQRFQQIAQDFGDFAQKLSLTHVQIIPLSALEGDNVVQNSSRMPWYAGDSLLHHLNHIQVVRDTTNQPLRFPIQWVNRPDANFRGFSGTIASGKLRIGDEVAVMPSQIRARIQAITTMDGDLATAEAGDAITVSLDREVDIARGDMLVHPDTPPLTSKQGEATLVWMSSTALVPGKRYWIKHASRRTSCEIETIRYRVDVNTHQQIPATTLAINEIGLCQIKFHDQLMLDPYELNRDTGSFILVDRVSHETVAAGLLASSMFQTEGTGYWDGKLRTTLHSAKSLVSNQDRALQYGHQPLTVLITGLSSSGKTSVAVALEKLLFEAKVTCVVLDGQTLRMGISRDLGFSAEERSENLRRAAEIARLINDAGQVCLAAFVAPSAWVREKARELIGAERFFHVHLTTPVDICRQRDRTGQYGAADRGEIVNFPGVTSEYESPQNADLTLDTQAIPPDQSAQRIWQAIQSRLMIA